MARAPQIVTQTAEREVVIQQMERLLAGLSDPVVLTDSHHRVVLQNRAAERFFQLPKRASEGTRRAVAQNNRVFSAMLAAVRGPRTESARDLALLDVRVGEEMRFEAVSTATFDREGQRTGMVTVLRKLSPLRKVEPLPVDRRTREMEKFAATGRLAGTLAHEVNNPMEAIKNAIYLLEDGVAADKKPVYDMLKNETERLARIVRQMLGLYRRTEAVGALDVNAIIEDTLLLFTRQLQRARVQVVFDLGRVPPALGSPDQLRQVLSNLVVNARDSMPNGGRLRLRTRERVDRRRRWVRILVADTGAGIAPEVLPAVFDPFVSTKGEDGTGLGLWIVKGIVEDHGGTIRVRSRVGQGTVFRIDLPVKR